MIGCRPLHDDEIPKLLAALAATTTGTRDQTLALLGITTGFRISELLSLKIRDVTTRGKINTHVRLPASRMKGKKRPRSALLAPAVHPYINAWLAELRLRRLHGGNRPLFSGRTNGAAISRVQAHRVLRAAFARAALLGGPRELACHTLRKTFAANMWEAHHHDLWMLQNALGHASPASTIAYLSFNDSDQTAAVLTAFAHLKPSLAHAEPNAGPL